MEVPGLLVEEIKKKRVVLMLGAGASMDATDSTGGRPPSGNALRDLLADKFLDKAFKDSPLGMVSEYAISESDIVTVQQFVASALMKYSPGSAHIALTKFSWRGLATTNYDQLVEAAYASESSKQNLVPFIENSDRVDKVLQESDSLAFLKLHGCVTRSTNPECPIILTPDQFLEFENGRNHVFQMFVDWFRESTIVFVGYKIDDINFRQILASLNRDIPSLPRSYMVTPNPHEIASRYWEKRNVRTLQGTFHEFMNTIGSRLNQP